MTETTTRQYDARLHAELTGIRMGAHHFVDERPLVVGDYVTHQWGGAAEFVGVVEAITDNRPDDDQLAVTVRWLSQHIGPNRTTTVTRGSLIQVGYTPRQPGLFDSLHRPHSGNSIAAWLLSAASRHWHVVGSPGSSGGSSSKGYDGSAGAWLWGKRVDVRFNATGEITWARIMGDHCAKQAYAVVVDGPRAGHTAMMWLIQSR